MEQIILNGISIDELFKRLEKLIDDKLESKAELKETPSSSFLSRDDVSKLLRISLVTLHSWTRKGLLKSYKIGARVLYKRQDIDDAILNNAIKTRKKH
jgi:excisionase family DNA binding protein